MKELNKLGLFKDN